MRKGCQNEANPSLLFFLLPPLWGPGGLLCPSDGAAKALAFATPQALQRLIDSAVAGERAVYSRWLLANAVLVIAFIAALYLRSYVKETTEGRVSAMAGHRVFQDMLSAPFAEVKKISPGALCSLF